MARSAGRRGGGRLAPSLGARDPRARRTAATRTGRQELGQGLRIDAEGRLEAVGPDPIPEASPADVQAMLGALKLTNLTSLVASIPTADPTLIAIMAAVDEIHQTLRDAGMKV